jgi:hypothetical protein
LEGYFRREWKLAIARTLDMADEKPFLVPVVIDETSDQSATVPELSKLFRGPSLQQILLAGLALVEAGETGPA